MLNPIQQPRHYFFDGAGKPLVGGRIEYVGTVYQDVFMTVPHKNPIVLDEKGSALIYFDDGVQLTLYNDRGQFIATQNLPARREQAFFYDKFGYPLRFGKVFTYHATTTQPKESYALADMSVTHDNPILLDGDGSASIYMNAPYRLRVYHENGVLVSDEDVLVSNTSPPNILNRYYHGQFTLNKSGNFSKNNCIDGQGTSVLFTKDYVGTSISSISQDEADRLAEQKAYELAINFEVEGQSYANEHGECLSNNIGNIDKRFFFAVLTNRKFNDRGYRGKLAIGIGRYDNIPISLPAFTLFYQINKTEFQHNQDDNYGENDVSKRYFNFGGGDERELEFSTYMPSAVSLTLEDIINQVVAMYKPLCDFYKQHYTIDKSINIYSKTITNSKLEQIGTRWCVVDGLRDNKVVSSEVKWVSNFKQNVNKQDEQWYAYGRNLYDSLDYTWEQNGDFCETDGNFSNIRKTRDLTLDELDKMQRMALSYINEVESDGISEYGSTERIDISFAGHLDLYIQELFLVTETTNELESDNTAGAFISQRKRIDIAFSKEIKIDGYMLTSAYYPNNPRITTRPKLNLSQLFVTEGNNAT